MKMMPKLSLILFAFSFYSHVVSARTRTNPFLIDYDNDVIDDLSVRQSDIALFQDQDENVQTIDNQRTISNTEEILCKPRPIPVKIPVLSHFITTGPRYVMLNRCLGPGVTSVQKCAVKTREKVVVKYEKLSTRVGSLQAVSQEESVVMFNDIECSGKACIAKPQDCNSNQIFRKCTCNCNLSDSYCQSINRYYDRSTCQCTCKGQAKCPLYQEWNLATCQCECAEFMKQMCQKHNLALDSNSCKCEANNMQAL
ncbi:uncharacterized protein LOC116301573 [Actinia tenebrosa]|uniref:Uncharacterized protein LOC116301573 n=1 Tax=Actinia tenebrosa TaxID=6105 RepID=A0A6P8IJ49_ACTTE|nr:uncharacterized protein LOC116301573 [Actinia tenebrosa]